MITGRPTDYSPQVIELAKEYRDNLPEDEFIHSVEGLAGYIGVARSTLYDWRSQDDKKEFSDIIEEILEKQAKSLLNNGLIGKFNSTITKVILSKHGYREGIEHMGDEGTPIKIDITKMLDKAYGDKSE